MSTESYTNSVGATTVAWISDIGLRDEQQDRAVAHVLVDRSWLIAVADGLGGQPRGAEASAAAISVLPERVASKDEMTATFDAAQQMVSDLAPEQARHRFGMIRRCPASTLCVAAWTPDAGLIVGAAGDTVAVVLWQEDEAWCGRSIFLPHRSNGMIGNITRYLGAPIGRKRGLVTDAELPAVPCAVAILSDGAWEPIVTGRYLGESPPSDPIAGAVVEALTPDDTDADAIAARIITRAQTAELDDNATLAVVHVAPAETRLQRMRSLALDDAERRLGRLPAAFISAETAGECLGISVDAARSLMADMERSRQSVRVCRDGWVLTLRQREEPEPPSLTAYLHDMMEYLGVGYYISYPAAAEIHGSSHHPVSRQRVNVEVNDLDSLDSLELRCDEGPADMAITYHQIDPDHGRRATLLDIQAWCPTGDGRGKRETCTARVATIETALFDMVEHPDRCSGMDHAATIARKALYKELLDAVLLAEASDRYEPQVARRVGSLLQHLRGYQHRFDLRPLLRRVRTGSIGPPIELCNAEVDRTRKPDRWGVTHARKLDPDC